MAVQAMPVDGRLRRCGVVVIHNDEEVWAMHCEWDWGHPPSSCTMRCSSGEAGHVIGLDV